MKLKTSKYVLKEEDSKRLIIKPDDYINYLKMVSGNGNVLKNVKKFKDSEVYIDGDLDLSNSNVTSLGPVDYIYGRLNITNSKISDIGDVEVRDGIVGGDYVTLKSYVKTGNSDLLNYLISSSSIIDDYNTKESVLDTEIELEMDDEKFFKMCGLSEDDIWFLNIVFSPYTDYEFFDSYSASEDFKEGYIYSYFDEDNIKKMIEIMETIAPELNIKTKENLVDNSQDVYEKMETYFEQETNNISYEYSSERNSAAFKATIEECEKELTDIFEEYGLIEVRLFNKYKTTVGNLIQLYDEYGKNVSVFKLFKTIADKNFSLPYFQEIAYQVTYDTEFNETGFNSEVYRNLDKIWDKIEDGYVEDMVEYKEILDNIKKRYEFNTFYELPKDAQKPKSERRLFKINKVDLSTNKIEVRINNPKTNQTITNHYSLEDFNLLLHHPELFESKKNHLTSQPLKMVGFYGGVNN